MAIDTTKMAQSDPNSSSKPEKKNSPNDLVTLNEAFRSNMIRLMLPTPALEEVYKKKKIEVDRSNAIDSCVIRIMKSKKRLEMSQLHMEVCQSLQMFQPQPSFVKQRIEKLI